MKHSSNVIRLTRTEHVTVTMIASIPASTASCLTHLPNGSEAKIFSEIYVDEVGSFGDTYNLTLWTLASFGEELLNYSCHLGNNLGFVHLLVLTDDHDADDRTGEG